MMALEVDKTRKSFNANGNEESADKPGNLDAKVNWLIVYRNVTEVASV